MQRRLFITLVIAAALLPAPGDAGFLARASGLASSLSDQELWQLSVDASEPSGYFRSDNLTSNELQLQYVVPELVRRTRQVHQPAVYLGVGPEQNFTYIAAVRPSMAVIFDIRRGNLQLQLMYKALFELAADRADFVSLLFSRARPPGLTAESSVIELFEKFRDVPSSRASYIRNLNAIDERLTKMHRLALEPGDLDGIERIYEAFYANGYTIRYSPTYDELMTATDRAGVHRGYLATEDGFKFLQDLETRNLVVPIVGDFGGPKAIRRVGEYLKAHGATVSAFYLSNVEQYLDRESKAPAFCRSVATLPLHESSTFIRSSSRGYGGYGNGRGFEQSLGDMAAETAPCSR
jgi:hypothetical protein